MSILDLEIEKAGAIVERLRQSKRVLIGSHERPDGDAVGSCLALYHALSLQGKEVTIYLPDAIPAYLDFLPESASITDKEPIGEHFDTIILLDYTQLYRTHLVDMVNNHPNTICIDHHLDNKGEASINLIVESAATAHILYQLFVDHEIPITNDIATCLLTGIFTDTGSFMHESTTPEILEVASDLMSKGARLSHIAQQAYQRKEVSGLRIWGRALSRAIFNEKDGISISVVTYKDLMECSASVEDLSGVVNMLNSLPGTKFSLLLAEYEPGKIKGSLRSEPKSQVDVSKIAGKLGGGGHKLASGFEISGNIVKEGDTWTIK